MDSEASSQENSRVRNSAAPSNSNHSSFNTSTPTSTPRRFPTSTIPAHSRDNPPLNRRRNGSESIDMYSSQTPTSGMRTPLRTPVMTPLGSSDIPRTPGSVGTPRYQRNDLGGALHIDRRRRGKESVPSTPASHQNFSSDDTRDLHSQSESEPLEVVQTFVWGTNVSVQDVTQKFIRFMKNFRDDNDGFDSKYMRILDELIEVENDVLNVNGMDIFNYESDLYYLLIKYPLEVVPIFDFVATDLAIGRQNGWLKNIQA